MSTEGLKSIIHSSDVVTSPSWYSSSTQYTPPPNPPSVIPKTVDLSRMTLQSEILSAEQQSTVPKLKRKRRVIRKKPIKKKKPVKKRSVKRAKPKRTPYKRR